MINMLECEDCNEVGVSTMSCYIKFTREGLTRLPGQYIVCVWVDLDSRVLHEDQFPNKIKTFTD